MIESMIVDACSDLENDVGADCDDANTLSLSHVLSMWGAKVDDTTAIPAIALPEPIVFLILRGRWTDVLFLLRWHQDLKRIHSLTLLIPGWPPAGSEPFYHIGEQRLEQPAVAPSEDACVQLAYDIKIWSAKFGAEEEASFSQAVQTLEQWAGSFSNRSRLTTLEAGKFKHSAEEMFAALRLSFVLKGGANKLAHALGLSLTLTTPQALQPVLMKLLNEPDTKPPGPSTVRRAELAFDLSFMYHRRKYQPPSFANGSISVVRLQPTVRVRLALV